MYVYLFMSELFLVGFFPALPTDTIVIIVVGAIAILLYLVIFIICLCVCAKCYRSSLRRKKLELVAMENEHARLSRKMSDAKDNSAILRHPGTPMLNTGPIHAPSSMYTVPRTPSPHETRRMETAFVDGRSAYPIPSPLPPVPTVVSDATELPNFPRGNLKVCVGVQWVVVQCILKYIYRVLACCTYVQYMCTQSGSMDLYVHVRTYMQRVHVGSLYLC